MRNGQNKRMRGRNRKGGHHQNPLSRMYESNGPDVKIRGTASHVAEKYLQLARDAQSSGDPVAAENYYQHAEHYFRLIAAAQEQFRQTQPYYQPGGESRGNVSDDGYDDGDGDQAPLGGEPFAPREPQPYFPREQQQQPHVQPQHMQPQHMHRSTRPAARSISPARSSTSSRQAKRMSSGYPRSLPAASPIHRRRNRVKAPTIPMARMALTAGRQIASRFIAGAGVIAARATIPCPTRVMRRRPGRARSTIDFRHSGAERGEALTALNRRAAL